MNELIDCDCEECLWRVRSGQLPAHLPKKAQAAPHQLGLGDLWQDLSGLVQCSCAAHGPVRVHDRPIEAGLVERKTRCEGCGTTLTWRMSAPDNTTKQRRGAPLLSTLKG
jgi:hypothetical protein